MSKYLTKEGFQRLSQQLKEYLKKRQEIAQRIEEAKALGDLSENADYFKAKEEQAFNEGKIRKIQSLLNNAEIVEETAGQGNNDVRINSSFTVEDLQSKTKCQYKIVGPGEANPAQGKISYESPLGQQFLGKHSNDIVEIKLPSGTRKYKIISIE